MLIRNKIHGNKDLASLPMEPPMPGRVADTKAALRKERMRIPKLQRSHGNKKR